jgi:hypothetical protein
LIRLWTENSRRKIGRLCPLEITWNFKSFLYVYLYEGLFDEELDEMTKFLLWLLLFIFCWPLALFALILYPFVWILLLPFRLVGIAVDGIFELLRAIVFLPARLLGGGKRK